MSREFYRLDDSTNLHGSMVREATVEYVSVSLFGAAEFACLSGVEVDDAGERIGAETVLLPRRLLAAIQTLNPELPPDTVEQVVRTVQRPPHPTLIENNRWLHGLLTNGVEVEYRDAATGENRGGRARLVDLLGLVDQLADALATYTQAGGRGDAVKKVQDEAVPAMQSAFEKLRAFFHDFDYGLALDAAPMSVLKVYADAANHVFEQDDGWKRFPMMVKELAMAFALVVPHPEAEAITPHLAFFQRVQAMIRKRLADERGQGAPAERNADIDAAVRQVIGGAVDAGEVIDLFAAAGLEDARLDIFSEEFLSRVAALEQKSLALETLRKLLTDQIRSTERTNLVQSKKFREALEDAMVRYTNKAITTAEMIARLLDLAKWVREVQNRGRELGLSTEETAFYDAIAENESACKAMENDKLRLMARELAEMVKRLPKLDWSQRESVRADLRRQVRRLLARYGYPPDLSEDATQLVLKQAELSTANGEL